MFYFLIFLLISDADSHQVNIAAHDCACEHAINFKELGRVEPPCEIPSTVILTEDNLRTELIITSCNGDASFKTYDSSNNKLKATGNFIGCTEYYERTDSVYVLNEITYEENMITIKTTACYPLKDGAWHYYND